MGAILAVGASASVASAAISLAPPGPFAESDITFVTGSAPTGAELVAVATCNTVGVPLGSRCDGVRAKGLLPVANLESEEGIELEVVRTFTDYSFLSGVPQELKTSTTCKNTSEVGDQCVVTANYYELVEGVPKRLPGAPDVEPIAFL